MNPGEHSVSVKRGAVMDERERLRTALRSTDDDLFLDNGRVIVCGRNDAGELVELGSVDYAAGCMEGVSAKALVDHVRFGPHLSNHGMER